MYTVRQHVFLITRARSKTAAHLKCFSGTDTAAAGTQHSPQALGVGRGWQGHSPGPQNLGCLGDAWGTLDSRSNQGDPAHILPGASPVYKSTWFLHVPVPGARGGDVVCLQGPRT